jgi:hypothetical protein
MKLLIVLAFISTSHAGSFKIAGEYLDFKTVDGLLVRGCESKCDALDAIRKNKKIDLKKIRKGMPFINSAGSDVCSKVYKAQSLLGVAENSDRRAFCFFKDKSMVEMNSLTSYLLEKKIVKD